MHLAIVGLKIMENSVLIQVGLILAITAGVSTIMKLLRQPLIIGYILTGLLIGPSFLGLFEVTELFDSLARFGIALLLFIIGLGLNPRVIKEVGKPAVVSGIGQVTFTALVGFVLAKSFGFDTTEAYYIAMALTLSSTIIVLKIISDKRETNQLYAKIITGLLLVQDIIATLLLLTLASDQQSSSVFEAFGYGALLLLGLFVSANYVFPRISKFVSESQEYLFLFSLAWGFGIAALFTLAGLSIEVGALFAGVALASQTYAQEVSSRLRPLRDFFIIVFFLVLGAEIDIAGIGSDIVPALIFSLFVLLGNPLIILFLLGIMGYTKKTSFKASMTVAQISEFSLVFIILAVSLGKIEPRIAGIVTLVGLITITISTYMMLFDEQIFPRIEKLLNLFERKYVREQKQSRHKSEIFLFGYKRGGREFVHAFDKLGKNYLVVDYDPEVIEGLKRSEQPFAYGDANDAEFLDEIDIENAKLVVSAITDFPTNLFLVTHVRARNPDAIVIVHAEHPEQAMQLYEREASYVMMPHFISSERISTMIRKSGLHKTSFKDARHNHMDFVRKHLG